MKISTVVLFHHNSSEEIIKCLDSVHIAARNAEKFNIVIEYLAGFTVFEPNHKIKNKIRDINAKYVFFADNTYHSRGINELVKLSGGDFLLILNPDTVVAPNLFEEFVKFENLDNKDTAAIECRQIPFDHPKKYNSETKETTWVSGACVFFNRKIFSDVGGFDELIFPMYCNDVDLSIRIKNLGYKLYFEPKLTVFHSKNISNDFKIARSKFEETESLNAYILMHELYGKSQLLPKVYSNPEFFKNRKSEIPILPRLEAVRKPSQRNIKKEILNQFFVNGEFGDRRYV